MTDDVIASIREEIGKISTQRDLVRYVRSSENAQIFLTAFCKYAEAKKLREEVVLTPYQVIELTNLGRSSIYTVAERLMSQKVLRKRGIARKFVYVCAYEEVRRLLGTVQSTPWSN